MKWLAPLFTSSDSYGTVVPSLEIHGKPAPYPVVNEREVRAVAGLMFAIGLMTLMHSFYTKDMSVVTVVVPVFFTEFFLKVCKGPSWSFLAYLVRPLINNQRPEYVGAIQKRFAWTLGLVFSAAVMFVLFGMQVRGVVPLSMCATCLVLMWLESAAGVCVGCTIYRWLIDKSILPKPALLPACPGGVCELPAKK